MTRLLIVARNAAIGVEDGRIVAPSGRFDVALNAPAAELRPGLINAHDHLHRNHYGRLGVPPYANAYAWAHDIQGRYRESIEAGQQLARRQALLVGAWKNLLAGVTTVMHHDRWESDFEENFPLRVLRLPNADSIGMAGSLDHLNVAAPYAIHLAEGIDPAAAEEVRTLDDMGLLSPRLIAVHGVGMDEEATRLFRASGAALTWCPTSNAFLFGRTARQDLMAPGMDILLGSDSLLTGAGNLLDEIRHARSLGYLDDARLESAVGDIAARRLGIAAPSLAIGSPADVILLDRPLLEASAANICLVLVGGVPRVADPDFGVTLEPVVGPAQIVRNNDIVRCIYPPQLSPPRATRCSLLK